MSLAPQITLRNLNHAWEVCKSHETHKSKGERESFRPPDSVFGQETDASLHFGFGNPHGAIPPSSRLRLGNDQGLYDPPINEAPDCVRPPSQNQRHFFH